MGIVSVLGALAAWRETGCSGFHFGLRGHDRAFQACDASQAQSGVMPPHSKADPSSESVPTLQEVGIRSWLLGCSALRGLTAAPWSLPSAAAGGTEKD